MVTSEPPSRLPATLAACSADFTSSTPCCLGLDGMVPLPRPPAWIWALTTAKEPPSLVKAAAASSAVFATIDLGTGTPAVRKISFAWNSWIFISTADLLSWADTGAASSKRPRQNWPAVSLVARGRL